MINSIIHIRIANNPYGRHNYIVCGVIPRPVGVVRAGLVRSDGLLEREVRPAHTPNPRANVTSDIHRYSNNNVLCFRVVFLTGVVRNLKANPLPLLRIRTGLQ
jgi:hypothetical protein